MDNFVSSMIILIPSGPLKNKIFPSPERMTKIKLLDYTSASKWRCFLHTYQSCSICTQNQQPQLSPRAFILISWNMTSKSLNFLLSRITTFYELLPECSLPYYVFNSLFSVFKKLVLERNN